MKKFLYSAVIGVTAFTLVGGAVALAYGGFGLDERAELIGITPEELKTQLEDNTMAEILDANGVTHQQIYELKQGHMLERQAETLGITIEELEVQLEDKTFAQLLDEAGISHTDIIVQKKAQHTERMTEYLQQMVDDGEITEEGMQEKIDWMASHEGKFGHKGFGMHRGFGFK